MAGLAHVDAVFSQDVSRGFIRHQGVEVEIWPAMPDVKGTRDLPPGIQAGIETAAEPREVIPVRRVFRCEVPVIHNRVQHDADRCGLFRQSRRKTVQKGLEFPLGKNAARVLAVVVVASRHEQTEVGMIRQNRAVKPAHDLSRGFAADSAVDDRKARVRTGGRQETLESVVPPVQRIIDADTSLHDR